MCLTCSTAGRFFFYISSLTDQEVADMNERMTETGTCNDPSHERKLLAEIKPPEAEKLL